MYAIRSYYATLASSQPPSKIGLKPGATVSVDFALQALLVYSANDMAYVLAEAAAIDVAGFASEMNRQARRLGMTGTHYVNPNGLFEPRQITTARDLAILVSTILKDFPEHRKYFSQDHLKVGKRKLANRNSLLRQVAEAAVASFPSAGPGEDLRFRSRSVSGGALAADVV